MTIHVADTPAAVHTGTVVLQISPESIRVSRREEQDVEHSRESTSQNCPRLSTALGQCIKHLPHRNNRSCCGNGAYSLCTSVDAARVPGVETDSTLMQQGSTGHDCNHFIHSCITASSAPLTMLPTWRICNKFASEQHPDPGQAAVYPLVRPPDSGVSQAPVCLQVSMHTRKRMDNAVPAPSAKQHRKNVANLPSYSSEFVNHTLQAT
jgi:hypothetical protein